MTNLLSIFEPIGELLTYKVLQDKDLLEKPLVISAAQSQGFESDKLPVVFSISAQGQMSVNLFNDENDADDLNLIGFKSDSTLTFDPSQEAYLKYDVQVYPKSKLSGTIGDLGLEINRERGIRLSFYRKHPNQTSIKAATQNDLPNFPIFFSAQELNNLQAHDAFAYSVEGELRVGGEISWSNMLSKSINLIPSLFSKAVTVDLAVSPKLTAKFDLSFKDHFSYVLRKNENGTYSISIAKIKNTSATGGLGASIGIKLSHPEVFEKQLDEIFESVCMSLASKSPKLIGQALEATKSGQANSAETAAIEKLADLFGLEDSKNSLDELKQKWENFHSKFKKGIKDSAESGALLTFSYEFKRIEEGQEILKATFPNVPELQRYHGDFLKLDMKPFLADFSAGKTNGVMIETYFNQTRIVSESAWGFGLRIWDKDLIQGKDYRKKEMVVKKDIRQHQQISMEAVRGYDWKLGKESGKWQSQFEVSMPTFSRTLEPTLTEFEFGWTLKYFSENVKINSEADLKKILDSGANWDCISPKEIDFLAQKHFPILSKERISFQKQIYFPDQVLKSVFQQIHFHGFNDVIKKLIAKSMASSLPFYADFPERTDLLIKERLYEKVWYHFLTNPKIANNSLAQFTADQLIKQIPDSNLPKFEKKGGNDNQGIWLADVAFTHPNLYQDLLSCLSGMEQIGKGLQLGLLFNNQIEKSYGKIENFLGQSFYLEVLGNFLLRLVSANLFAKDAVQKVLSISHDQEGEPKTIHIGMI